jgi:hypothetical protein
MNKNGVSTLLIKRLAVNVSYFFWIPVEIKPIAVTVSGRTITRPLFMRMMAGAKSEQGKSRTGFGLSVA